MSTVIAMRPFDPAPMSRDEVLDPAWLSEALRRGGYPVEVSAIRLVDAIGWNCISLLVEVDYEGPVPDGLPSALCIKGLFGKQHREYLANGVLSAESHFYRDLAPEISMRLARCFYAGAIDESGAGVVVLEDLNQRGVRFRSHLDALSLDAIHQTLDQLARLHGNTWNRPVDWNPWMISKLDRFASPIAVPPARLTEVLETSRGDCLPDRMRNGDLVYAGIAALAERNKTIGSTNFIHGDCHIGNIFEVAGEYSFFDLQISQRAHWSIDLPYHIGSVMPVEMRREHEQELLRFYLDRLGEHGGEPPEWEVAWRQYREGAPYGFYLWAITLRVDPPIIDEAVKRLGSLVADHDSYSLLGL